jgi:carbon monoxide dehydrogenase subunit G
MELTNQFKVNVPVEQAWEVLTDVETIAPCLPGAELREVVGDEYRGVVKVKVGPITAEYKGAAHFVELDPVAHKAVLRAEGRETRGQGNASATITASLEPDGGGSATKVSVVTDLTVAGKVAQFGRGVLGEVSNKLMTQFAESLESTVLAARSSAQGPGGDGVSAASPPAGEGASTAATSPAASPASASVDLVKVVGPILLKRVLPVLGGVGVLAAFLRLLRRAGRLRQSA